MHIGRSFLHNNVINRSVELQSRRKKPKPTPPEKALGLAKNREYGIISFARGVAQPG
jgi:hypothetical protein